jgi:sulfur-oxidizing protein SoxZ
MAIDVRTRISVPPKAGRGEIVEIKSLIAHPMESGERRDADGNPLPRHIIHKVECLYNGEVGFSGDWFPAVAVNPYLAFTTIATESGEILIRWHDDDGSIYTASAPIEVA